jgi:hypothetical protein
MKLVLTTVVFPLLAFLLIASSAMPASSIGGTCRAKGTKPGPLYVLECGATCSGGSDECSKQKPLMQNVVWCGCDSTPQDCCHLVGNTVDLPVSGGYNILSWGYDGDCLSCPLAGICQVISHDNGTPQFTADDFWTANCD